MFGADQFRGALPGDGKFGRMFRFEEPIIELLVRTPICEPDRESKASIVACINMRGLGLCDCMVTRAVERHGQARDGELVAEAVLDAFEPVVYVPAIMTGVVEEAHDGVSSRGRPDQRAFVHVEFKVALVDLENARGRGLLELPTTHRSHLNFRRPIKRLAGDKSDHRCETKQHRNSREPGNDVDIFLALPRFLGRFMDGREVKQD